MQCSVFQLHTCTTLHLAHMEILAKFLRPKSAIISPKANSIAMTSVHYIHASAATFSPTLALGITERAALRGSKQRSKLTNTHSMVRHSSATTDSPSPLSNLPCQTAAPPCSSQKSPYHALWPLPALQFSPLPLGHLRMANVYKSMIQMWQTQTHKLHVLHCLHSYIKVKMWWKPSRSNRSQQKIENMKGGSPALLLHVTFCTANANHVVSLDGGNKFH